MPSAETEVKSFFRATALIIGQMIRACGADDDDPLRPDHQKTTFSGDRLHECSRLIANAIIYYNTLLLSRVYEQKLTAGDLEAIKVLKSTSPVAWRNVNLIGNFDFTTNSSPVDIEALAARYQDEDFWRRSMTEGDDDGPQA